ncbi:MAG: hypothetical protein HQ464_13125 [Planctomycetes bacterium]|nr:hypothetical protein [Planctomycetota bacterium]
MLERYGNVGTGDWRQAASRITRQRFAPPKPNELLAATPHLLWTLKKDTPDVASPLLSDGRLYFFKEKTGLLSCVDATSGRPHYTASRIPGMTRTYASPVAANGCVYLTDRSGMIVVIEDKPVLKVLATNEMDEGVDATPAAVGVASLHPGRESPVLHHRGPVTAAAPAGAGSLSSRAQSGTGDEVPALAYP